MSSYRKLITKHGEHTYPVHSLHGSAVLVLDRVFRMRGARPLQPGTLLIPRLEKPTKRVPRTHFKHQIFGYGLYDAIRWAIHVKRGYFGGDDTRTKGEVRNIEKRREAIKRALKWLDVAPADLPPEAREPVEALIRKQAELLGKPRDERKVRAKQRLERGSTSQDSRGRTNVSAQMGSAAGARSDLGLRLGLINFIVPRIGAREIALLNEADRVRKVFVDAWNSLGRAIVHYERNEPGKAGFEVAETRTALLTIRVGPYPAHIARIVRDLDGLDESVHVADKLVLLRRARESLRLKRARWELEGLVTQVSLCTAAKVEPGNDVRRAWADRLAKFRERLAKIDETGFKKPVVPLASKLIKRAEEALVDLEAPLAPVKKLVRDAARKL